MEDNKCFNPCIFSKACEDSASYNTEMEVVGSQVWIRVVSEIGNFLAYEFRLSGDIAETFKSQLLFSKETLIRNIQLHQRLKECKPCFDNYKMLVSC